MSNWVVLLYYIAGTASIISAILIDEPIITELRLITGVLWLIMGKLSEEEK